MLTGAGKEMASPTNNTKDFKEFLAKNSIEKRQKMDSILHIDQANSNDVHYEFCLIRCDPTEIRENDYLQLLHSHLWDYALSYAELHPKKLTKEKIVQYFIENGPHFNDQAKSTYVTKSSTTGDPGELFLFVALESIGFIRILNKMALKTNGEVPFQGWDAVHIGVGKYGDILFAYGSSKLKKKLDKALYETFSDIEGFSTTTGKEEHEIKLVSSYIESGRLGKYTKEIAKMLTPYYREKERIGRAHPIFIGYQWDSLKNLKRPENGTLDNHLHEVYKQTHQDMINRIDKQISKLSVASKREFYVWIIPFEDLQRIRNKFLEKLGVKDCLGDECYE